MSGKAVWKGALNVGRLLNLNVKLYKATDDYKSELRELHVTCSTPMNRKDVCTKCNVEVPRSDVVKGVPQDDGTFVVLSADELKSIKPESSEVIAITTFVPGDTVDPLFIGECHYLMPDGNASQQAYATLVRGLLDTKRVGQGRFCFYGRERTVTLRVVGSGLVMQSMLDANHVRDITELPGYTPTGAVDANAVKLMSQLIDLYVESAFDPSEYEDEHAKALAALVDARKKGAPLPVATSAPKTAQGGDLMATLRAALGTKAAVKKPVKVEAKTAKRKRA